MAEPTPTTLEQFTPAWLTEQLRKSDTIGSETTVTGVEKKILGEGEGFMGIVARLSLSYEGPAGPASMIAKIPTSVDKNRAAGRAIGVYEREVRVYADILPTLGVPQPEVYGAIYEADGHEKKLREQTKKVDRFPLFLLRWLIKREQGKSDVPPCVVLIEDLTEGEIGDQVKGGSPEQMAGGLATLARLHAETWNVKNIPNAHWAEGPDHIPRLIQALYLNGHDEFIKQASPHFSTHSIELYKSLRETGIDRVVRQRTEVPQVLAHGDYRLDNLFFAADGSVTAVIDWQTAVPAPVGLDVSYFLVSSLPAETPESVVDDLLARYHAELVANGVNDYSFDSFMADYLDGLLITLHRLTGLAEVVDLGDGRGLDLLGKWLKRADARLQRVTA